ncbi:MAG: VWA domain-containing protein, partial [Chloroflexota bacterium]
FGGKGKGKKARCETRLVQPLAPLKKAKALKLVSKLSAPKKVRTPLGAAIAAVADDLGEVEGARIVVLVTDGDETCGGDPDAAIEALKASGIDVNVNIVGFALEDQALKDQMAAWAAAGGGNYYDASIADELAASLAQALAAPFRVYTAGTDEPLASGTVGGAGVLLEPGTYRVEVLSDPLVVFEDVIIEGGTDATL